MALKSMIGLIVTALTIKICLMACLPSELGPDCVQKCPSNKVIYQQNCIDSCPLNTVTKETALSRYCFSPNEPTCQTITCSHRFPNCYRIDCLQECPEFTVEYNKTCSMECPTHAPLLTAHDCTGICLSGKKTCSEKCPATHPFSFSTDSLKMCLNQCPDFTAISGDNCALKCPFNASYLLNNTCISQCPTSHPFTQLLKTDYNEVFTCEEVCPKDTVLDETRCVESCPKEKHLFNNTCVTICPEPFVYLYPKYKKYYSFGHPDPRFKTYIENYGRANFVCVDNCNSDIKPSYPGYIHVRNGNFCTTSCPKTAPFEFNESCISSCPASDRFHRSNFGRLQCVPTCQPPALYFHETCVETCPNEAKFILNSSCVSHCDRRHPFEYNEGGFFYGELVYRCLNECPSESVIYNETKCVTECPKEAKYIYNKTCIDKCPDKRQFIKTTQIKYKRTSSVLRTNFECVEYCSNPSLSYNNMCVTTCPNIAKFNLNGTCTNRCSKVFPFENVDIVKVKDSKYYWKYLKVKKYFCVESCPKGKYIYNNSKCVDTCPTEANYEINGTCQATCTSPLEYKIQKGSYYKCVESCDDLLVYNKTCLSKCPPDAPYKINRTCVSQCYRDLPYKFINHTDKGTTDHMCLKDCPSKTLYFNDSCVFRCPDDLFTYNSSCISTCPDEASTNYTKNNERFGLYTCVSDCPEGTVIHNGTCYDICPGTLNSHLSTCKPECPKSHPYINTQTKTCVTKCPEDFVVSVDNICVSSCLKDAPFIDKVRCTKVCIDPNSVYEITSHGKLCHKKCPHHLVLMENDKMCTEKCPNDRLIVDDICRKLDKCPGHNYIEHSGIGKRCTNMCSKGFFLDDTKCVTKCPKEKVIAGNQCLESCPPSFPLSYKQYSYSNPQITCYSVCPTNYIANGSVCIDEYQCSGYRYNHVCHVKCPFMTVVSGTNDCKLLIDYIIPFILLTGLSGILCALLYLLVCFTGTSTMCYQQDKANKVTLNVNPSIRTSYKDLLHAEETIELNNGNNDTDSIQEIDDGYWQ